MFLYLLGMYFITKPCKLHFIFPLWEFVPQKTTHNYINDYRGIYIWSITHCKEWFLFTFLKQQMQFTQWLKGKIFFCENMGYSGITWWKQERNLNGFLGPLYRIWNFICLVGAISFLLGENVEILTAELLLTVNTCFKIHTVL